MDMKGKIPVIIFTTSLQIFMLYAYNLKCPEQANWKFRAIEKCNSTLTYFCLYNNVYREYVEGCTGPDWDRKGNKRIYAGDFTREKCIQTRFQPFKFWTNESTSDCIYSKSICSEDGQLIFNDTSTKDDRTCRCNYKTNYSFVVTPRNACFCIPTEEDCSCHIKSCPDNFILSADYECIGKDSQKSSKCIDLTKYSETLDENKDIITDNDHWLKKKAFNVKTREQTNAITISVVFMLFIIVAGVFVFAVLFGKWIREQIHLLTETVFILLTDNDTESDLLKKEEQLPNAGVQKPLHFVSDDSHESSIPLTERTPKRADLSEPVEQLADQTTDMEVNYLRMIHLLFRVVCPVVRNCFDYEIEPKQLRSILNKNQATLRKHYRQKDNIVDDAQWSILFGKAKGKTVYVTSDDFDIRLMIYLLKTIAKVDVGDLYPLAVDISISAMLSRIKFIRNETTQSIEGELSKKQYNKFWDDIGQAVLKLVSSHSPLNINDERRKQVIDRLIMLNPINIDNDKVFTFIVQSEIYPAMILRQFLSEYCASEDTTINQLLRQEAHWLYHKREKTTQCCSCTNDKYATYIKLLPEKQWLALYELTDCVKIHSTPCKSMNCYKLYVPKTNPELDLSVLVSLVLYIPKILQRFASHFPDKKFEKFLVNNQHLLYHSMETTRCCKCDSIPTWKKILHENEWNTLFIKCNKTNCKTGNENCCCQFSVRVEIKTSSLDNTLLCKIFDIAGPLADINKIEQDAFSYFLNWTVCDKPLQRTLTDLLCFIRTKTNEIAKMSKDIFSNSPSQEVEASMKRIENVEKWIEIHIREQSMQKSTLNKSLYMLVRIKECMKVKHMQIPSNFNLTDRIRKFEDITPEENNFLVVFHTLKKIVHPVITNQLNKTCSGEKLIMVLNEIYHGRHNEGTHEGTQRKRQKLYLSNETRSKIFCPANDDSKKLDLELMIYILTQEDIVTVDHQNEWREQLKVINEIRREIMQSSSGILKGNDFQDVMESISKAVLFWGGEEYMKELTELSNNTHIFDWIKKKNMAKMANSDVSTTFPKRLASYIPETNATTFTSETGIPKPTSMCNILTVNSTSATSSVIPNNIHSADTNN